MKHCAKMGYYQKTVILGLGPMSEVSTLQVLIHDRKPLTIFAKIPIIDV